MSKLLVLFLFVSCLFMLAACYPGGYSGYGGYDGYGPGVSARYDKGYVGGYGRGYGGYGGGHGGYGRGYGGYGGGYGRKGYGGYY